MSETKDTTDKPAAGGAKKSATLSLKRTVDTGVVRQSFSHGRTKPVQVEVVKKKRPLVAPGGQPRPEDAAAAKGEARPQSPGAAAAQRAQQRPRAGDQARNLSDAERDARQSALEAQRARELELRRRREEDEARQAELDRARAEEAAAEAERQQSAGVGTLTLEPSPQPEAPSGSAAATATAPPEASPPAVTEAAEPAPTSAAPASQPAAAARATAPAARSALPSAGDDSGALRTAGTTRPATARSGALPHARTRGEPIPPPVRQRDDSSRRPQQIVLPTDRRPAADKSKADARSPADAAERTKPGAEVRRPDQIAKRGLDLEEDDDRPGRKLGGVAAKKAKVAPVTPKSREEKRPRGKLTITNAFDETQRERSLASLRRKREREKLRLMGVPQAREKIVREVVIPEAITIQDLANRMTERAVDVIKFLMKQGAMHQINDVIDADTAELIVQEFGHSPKRVSEADVEIGFISTDEETGTELQARAPIVTIMGHVDHGKTSLLDAIREANVAAGEAGGITQHIGAYQVETADGSKITFIDTPGHEAFTAMRARGAKVTDIVVLVVAADDGVMPQTVEAINHAKAAKVPIIVAINKMDKPDANPDRVRNELLQHEIVVESLSGDTQDVPVSAIKRTNLDKLLEAIALQAEILELKANPNRSAEGVVIEAKLDRGRGPVGTVLVQRGTLHVGDIIVAGTAWGRVRALVNEKGENVREAGPSVPVEVLGFDSAPEAGDQLAVVDSEGRARELTDYRIRKRRETLGASATTGTGVAGGARTLEQMMQQLKQAGRKEFTLLVKGDVQGSVEAITGALRKLGTEEVEARIVHAGVGGITESDVSLANASGAVICGFNTRANVQAKAAADRMGVEIRYYSIIYDLVDEVKAAMSGLLAPTKKEVFLGYAAIKQVFNISKVGKVAGCVVTEGKVERGAKVRLLRDKVVIHEGTLAILKRFKDDVREVTSGQECGMSFASYQDIREGDEIECFNVEIIARSL